LPNDAKEWKTVKIEAPVRDDAQADPRTYSEIMRAGLDETPTDAAGKDKIAQAVAERLEGAKPLEDMAFDDWWEPDHAQTIALSVVDELEDVDIAWDEPETQDFADQLDRIEAAAKEATNAAQNAERAAEELGGQR